jgi:hypothetical protein
MSEPYSKFDKCYFIEADRSSSRNEISNNLKWWNTFYKAMHEWSGGRIEVKFQNSIKGYGNNDMIHMSCPYCNSALFYKVKSVHSVKGNIVCQFCRKSFGINPNGQVYIIRPVLEPTQQYSYNVRKLKNRLLRYLSGIDASLEEAGSGVNVYTRNSRVKSLLEEYGFRVEDT